MTAVFVLRSTESMVSFSVNQKDTKDRIWPLLIFLRAPYGSPIPDGTCWTHWRPGRPLGGDRQADRRSWSPGVSVAGIAARESVTAKRSRREMAPQRLEKIESAPGNGMVSEASNPQDLVRGRPCAS